MATTLSADPYPPAPTEQEVFITVCSLLGLSVVIIPFHLLALYIPIRFFPKNASFQLLARLIFLDFLQNTGLILSGLYFFIPGLYDLVLLRRIYGVILCCFFPAMFALKCELTLYRILISLRIARPEQLPIALKIFEALIWLLVFALCIGAYITKAMDFNMSYWAYNPDSLVATILAKTELYVCIPFIVVTYVLYTLLLAIIYSLKRKAVKKFRKSREEWTLFAQNTVTTVYYIAIILIFHVPGPEVEASLWYFIFNAVAWITTFYWTSLLLLFCNKAVRRKIRTERTDSMRMFTIMKKDSTSRKN